MRTWRFIDTGINCASLNMAFDEALLDSFKENEIPLLRFYGWKPSLSFGRFSKVYNNIDLEKLKSISYARRITGGGILLHGGDISYTIILPKSSLGDMGVKKSYSYLCRFLLKFYENIGYSCNFTVESDIKSKSSEVCLDGNEPYDILYQGKKLGGNAQRYVKEIIFQHGSIPIRFNSKFFEPLFLKGSGLHNAVSLSQMGIDKDVDELKNILKDSFCSTFECKFTEDELTSEETAKAKELFEEKYSLDSWNIDGKFDS